MDTLVDTLHDATHRIPGVPAHLDATSRPARQAAGHQHRRHQHAPRLHSPARHHAAPPRVLVAWQIRIVRVVRGLRRQG
ncbi:hypothetical protein ABZ477_11335 [Microbacterium sp. NPDC019599]|uniref:hypothetical protein n=1 Tax=Microbacterium sp. NPDC019599 TaxID=3154690 RepID=UPI0033D85E9F